MVNLLCRPHRRTKTRKSVTTTGPGTIIRRACARACRLMRLGQPIGFGTDSVRCGPPFHPSLSPPSGTLDEGSTYLAHMDGRPENTVNKTNFKLTDALRSLGRFSIFHPDRTVKTESTTYRLRVREEPCSFKTSHVHEVDGSRLHSDPTRHRNGMNTTDVNLVEAIGVIRKLAATTQASPPRRRGGSRKRG